MNYITTDKYEGCPVELVKLLKQDKFIKGNFWDGDINQKIHCLTGYLRDYTFDDGHFPYFADDENWYAFFEPIFEEETDWSKVSVDTLLEVSEYEDFQTPQKRYFAKVENNILFCWKEGRSSKTATDIDDVKPWKYGRIIKE